MGALVDFGPCPECGSVVTVHVDVKGIPVGVIHGLPMCGPYAEKEAGAFLTWVLDVRDAARRPAVDA